MVQALKRHWPEYLMEASGLGLFMTSACLFASLLEHPPSTVHQRLSSPILRRGLMGINKRCIFRYNYHQLEKS